MTEPSPQSIQALIAQHAPFMERLASALVRHPDQALDLAQESWADVLRRPAALIQVASDGGESVRSWLSVLVRRRVASQLRRSRPMEGLPDGLTAGAATPDEISERLERQTLVQEVLNQLEDPYRTLLVLRFQDDLRAAEIARRTGTPASTIRSQISHGLTLLQAELDRRHPGGRTEWIAALLPLCDPGAAKSATVALKPQAISAAPPAASSFFALFVMKKASLVAAAAIASGLLAIALVPVFGPTEPSSAAGDGLVDRASLVPVAARQPLDPGSPPEPRRGPQDREQISTADSPIASQRIEAASALEESASITGRAVLFDGTPLTGMRVWARSHEAEPGEGGHTSQIDADGKFAILGLTPGAYSFKVLGEWGVANAGRASVQAPAKGVDLRLDAVMLRAYLPAEFDMARLEPFGPTVVRLSGPEQSSSAMHGGAGFNADGVLRRLLPSGPGYAVQIAASDGADLLAVLESGLPSGAYDVDLVSESPAFASASVVVSGERIGSPGRLTVSMQRVVQGEPKDFDVALFFERGERQARTGVLLPGEYRVKTRLFGPPPKAWLVAEVLEPTFKVQAGDEAAVEVQLVEGGGLSVTTESPDTTPPQQKFRIEVWDDAKEEWRSHTVYVQDGDTYQTTSRLERGMTYHSWEPLPAGEARFRVRAEGFQSTETNVSLRAGALTPWKPLMLELP